MYSLIIFDLDGTLAHTAPDLIGTLNRITAPHDLKPAKMADVGQIVGHGAKAMIARAFELENKPLNERLHDELFEAFLEDYFQNLANETHLFDGVTDAMDGLSEKGFEFAVCTNKKHSMAVPLLEQLGVSDRFRAVTGGDSFEFRKPDARHLEETAKLAGHEINKAIMIGDSETDINAAKNAGIPSVAVTFGYTNIPASELG
ncbi:MAG: HAD-IA family hydrolase, partial [Rhizobiaceae bacterium]|nr:HAD-IA family hydrolase [Rhizobiaceae bacterium]